eukprot:8174811-Pyramimonas_sp.AAC.1
MRSLALSMPHSILTPPPLHSAPACGRDMHSRATVPVTPRQAAARASSRSAWHATLPTHSRSAKASPKAGLSCLLAMCRAAAHA